MTLQDHLKLLNAGYTIVRPDDHPRIRIKTLVLAEGILGKDYVSSANWKTLENYPTKAARDRALKDMLQDRMTILD